MKTKGKKGNVWEEVEICMGMNTLLRQFFYPFEGGYCLGTCIGEVRKKKECRKIK